MLLAYMIKMGYIPNLQRLQKDGDGKGKTYRYVKYGLKKCEKNELKYEIDEMVADVYFCQDDQVIDAFYPDVSQE